MNTFRESAGCNSSPGQLKRRDRSCRALLLPLIVLVLGFPAIAHATSYYVSASTGNDANDGKSAATAWKSLNKINKGTFATGDSVFLHAGDSWENQYLSIGWSGTVASHVIVGAYYVNSANIAIRGIGSYMRPIINGDWSGIAPISPSHPSNSASAWRIGLSINGSYVDVENIEIEKYGQGLFIGGNFDTANNIFTNGTYQCGIHAANAHDITIENSEIYNYVAVNDPQAEYKDSAQSGQRCSGMVFWTVTNGNFINNYIHEGWAEGFIAENGSKNITVKNNNLYATAALGIYIDTTAGAEIAYNLIMGTSNPNFWWGGKSSGAGIVFGDEAGQFAGYTGSGAHVGNNCPYGPYSSKYTGGTVINGQVLCTDVTQDVRVHDNIVVGRAAGFNTYTWYPGNTIYSGAYVPFTNFQFYNNTFVDNLTQLNFTGPTYNATLKNNIFLSVSAGTADFSGASNATDVLTNNYWSQGKPGGGLAGSGDVYGGLKLAQMSGFRSQTSGTGLTASDFAQQSGSSAIGRGTPLLPSPYNTDFFGHGFRNPMDMGAIASGSAGTPAPTECTFNGQTVANGANVTAYLAANVASGSNCTSQIRTCNNGTLSGSYTYASCTVASGSACTFNGLTVANGASVTAYLAQSVPYGQTCSSQTRTCSNGHLSGTDAYASCSVDSAAGNSVSPNPAHVGQTLTAKVSTTITQSDNGAMVVFWYRSNTGALLGRSVVMGANFVADQPITLSTTYKLPTTAANGTYSVSGTIYKDSKSGIAVGSIPTFASFTIN